MAFSSNQDDDVLSEINITPLVDVMLVLLVAFIVTTPLLNKAIQVNLPKTEATASSDPKKPLTVSVDDAGAVWFDKQPVPLSQVESQLEQRKQEDTDLAVSLQADERVPYGPVAKVMGAVQHAGITKLSLVTQPEQ
ncbi:biopolymer transporter protein ExbD [Burkholderia aenigmatica]|uniref:Biopolymer transporter protein ExbD n=1 Tax=Burkholderia aenigmatica TaxID=2015348 RepID=A0A6P2PLE3_9BURK|nr:MULTISPECIES: biopolymer transporter ExbD [Burkholderia]MDN7513974.1 biopolymer transporter ExbD [Burkholderia sp. AU45251]VWC07764.1 biopolymer transporter protein ExbD [Burkholderia aenigmatica]HDR9481403.1 biopolymer transporter ExbD [Burkholderia aenigmatica]HDR9512930.1 biopolymer transporter ExbD [Burkholderia aenigmatica]HDR9589774.1 biopolymer transporter ExbD [Burkholderia aenigmatica]